MPRKTQSHWQPTRRLRGIILKLLRRTIVKRRMQPLPIIEPLDEFFNMLCQLVHRGVSAAVNLYTLQRSHETFTVSVLPRPRWAAHTDKHVRLFQSTHILVTGVLSAAIGVMHQARARLP